jgi:hypothetical protein
MRFDRDLAFILLAVYLILVGLMGLGIGFAALGTIAAICALAAGILMLIYR